MYTYMCGYQDRHCTVTSCFHVESDSHEVGPLCASVELSHLFACEKVSFTSYRTTLCGTASWKVWESLGCSWSESTAFLVLWQIHLSVVCTLLWGERTRPGWILQCWQKDKASLNIISCNCSVASFFCHMTNCMVIAGNAFADLKVKWFSLAYC